MKSDSVLKLVRLVFPDSTLYLSHVFVRGLRLSAVKLMQKVAIKGNQILALDYTIKRSMQYLLFTFIYYDLLART